MSTTIAIATGKVDRSPGQARAVSSKYLSYHRALCVTFESQPRCARYDKQQSTYPPDSRLDPTEWSGIPNKQLYTGPDSEDMRDARQPR
jgi:hypothetical protein